MHRTVLIALVLAARCLPGSAGGVTADELYPFYEERDFFALAERLPGLDAHDPRRAFLAGQVDAAFQRDDQAERELRQFLVLADTKPEWRGEAWLTLGNSRLRRGAYADAAEAFGEALRIAPTYLSVARKLDAEQNLALARVLKEVPAQTTSVRGKPVRLPVRRDPFGLLHIDARINGEPDRGLFDTLAGGNVASDVFARQHKLRMLPGAVIVTTITGAIFSAQTGVADEVRIGGMAFRNVVFTILPDTTLDLAGSGESSSLIIGLPLILALEHVRYDGTAGELEVGLPPGKPGARNVAFDGLMPLVRVRYGEQAMPFVLDTGMQQTKVLPRFGQRFPQALAGAVAHTLKQIGLGSSRPLLVRRMPTLELSAGGGTVRLQNVVAMGEERSFLPRVGGVVGADFWRGGFELDFRAGRFALLGATAPAR